MKLLTATATAALALTASACSAGGSYKPVARLDCPETEDGLKRVSQAADGKTCAYVSTDGAQITLKLIPVSGGVDATLQSVEHALRADLAKGAAAAAPAAGADAEAAAAAGGTGSSATDAAATIAQAEADARAVPAREAAAEQPAEGAWENDWDSQGRGGEHTEVDLPGVHITAKDESAKVRIGPLHIDANDAGAEISMQRDVRLKGEALSRQKRGVRATFVLAGDDLPGGYKFAGYEAGGPRTGPLAVAVVKGQSGDHDEIYDAVKKLVRRNGGV